MLAPLITGGKVIGTLNVADNRQAAAALTTAAACHDCSSPCSGACPFGRQIQDGLVEAHEMLSLPRPARVTA